ncbi:MAG: hypothetical protein FD121_795 [Gallionellaceae bacterium]|nr:MAG: hypothetical protein FD121_795 [Gallionellaceae bacterium]
MEIGILTHPLGIALQCLGIYLALRLIPLSGRSNAWLTFSSAFVLMGVRLIGELLEHFEIILPGSLTNNFDDLLSLLITILMVVGIYLIRTIFEERQQSQQKLQQQLDELLRFQKVTVGRELRMKELVEENTELRCQHDLSKSARSQP